MIFYGRQSINEDDITAVVKVLQSDFLTQGPAIEKFEQYVANYCGAKYAVAVTNATSALHIACVAAGLKKGDILWTSPITFVASANCGRYCGADVDFVDIDAKTYNMSVDMLGKKLALAAENNKLPKVIIPVHFAGQSCDMAEIYELVKKYDVAIIEDASHAVGAEYLSHKVGSCRYSDMTVFSFHPVKITTTGEGGMVLTNDEALYEKLNLLRSHGITRNPTDMTRKTDGDWYYQQIMLGYNYRMTDIQAALGYSQMQRVDEFVTRRRYLAKRYNELLKDLPLILPYQAPDTNSSWHLYVVRIDFSRIKISKQELFKRMQSKGVTLNLHYIPVHTQPYYENLGFRFGDFPVSEKYYEEAVTLPLYYELSDEKQEYIAEGLQDILQH